MLAVELWEANDGSLFLVAGDRIFDVSFCIGDDAVELMQELWETSGAVTWTAVDEYSAALSNVLQHPETRRIALYGVAGLSIDDRPGNAGQMFLGPYYTDTE